MHVKLLLAVLKYCSNNRFRNKERYGEMVQAKRGPVRGRSHF